VIEVFGRTVGANAVEISVKDNGRGIDPRDMERVFELFRRSGPQDRPGEGIGLAHVRPLVRRMGGAITCTSELGVGTEFKVVLPQVLKHDGRGRG
jgi:signal transduction histidine kinase